MAASEDDPGMESLLPGQTRLILRKGSNRATLKKLVAWLEGVTSRDQLLCVRRQGGLTFTDIFGDRFEDKELRVSPTAPLVAQNTDLPGKYYPT